MNIGHLASDFELNTWLQQTALVHIPVKHIRHICFLMWTYRFGEIIQTVFGKSDVILCLTPSSIGWAFLLSSARIRRANGKIVFLWRFRSPGNGGHLGPILWQNRLSVSDLWMVSFPTWRQEFVCCSSSSSLARHAMLGLRRMGKSARTTTYIQLRFRTKLVM